MNPSNYHIERTVKSPMISASAVNGEILMQGRSYPENAAHFFAPFMEWYQSFKAENPPSITFTMDLEYFNTSTAGILFDFIEKLFELPETIDLKVVWRFESDDQDMSNKGQSLRDHFGERFVLDVRPEE